MEFVQLTSFLRVAERGNVTVAAAELYLSQPAITQHIKSLEREMGVALFERTGRGMRLTATGAVLRDYAERSLALLEDAARRIDDIRNGTTGKLAIGAGVTTSIFHLPAWLRDFRREFPEVDITVATGKSREILDLVKSRKIEVGIVTSPIHDSSLTIMPIREEEIILVRGAGNTPAIPEIAIDDLSRVPLILFAPNTGFRTYLDSSLALAGITANIKMESDSVEAIKGFVSVGLGASFLPTSAVEAECADGSLVRLRVSGMPPLIRRTSAVYRADRYITTAAAGFLAVLERASLPVAA